MKNHYSRKEISIYPLLVKNGLASEEQTSKLWQMDDDVRDLVKKVASVTSISSLVGSHLGGVSIKQYPTSISSCLTMCQSLVETTSSKIWQQDGKDSAALAKLQNGVDRLHDLKNHYSRKEISIYPSLAFSKSKVEKTYIFRFSVFFARISVTSSATSRQPKYLFTVFLMNFILERKINTNFGLNHERWGDIFTCAITQ